METVTSRCPVSGRKIKLRLQSVEEARQERLNRRATPWNIIPLPVGGCKRRNHSDRSGRPDMAEPAHGRALRAALRLWELRQQGIG